MIPSRSARIAALLTLPLLATLGACSRGQPTTTAQAAGPTATTSTSAPPLQPMPSAVAAPAGQTVAASPADGGPLPPVSNGYSCSFPGPGGRSILARFTLDGATAHDDQGMAFTVLTNSPTALVLAHARDDQAGAPGGDIGAYLVAIDRRTLGMVQSTVGLGGPDSTRRGHCIAG